MLNWFIWAVVLSHWYIVLPVLGVLSVLPMVIKDRIELHQRMKIYEEMDRELKERRKK